MPTPKLNPEFVVTIAQRNDRGEVVSEKEFVTYPGLLALAHELGLEEISTTVLQMPTEANGQTAVIRAVAKGKPGLFTGIGDASPLNTNRKVARHLIRVAETRAKARALRDLTNVNFVAFEELGGDDDLEEERRETWSGRHAAQAPAANGPVRRSAPASDAQRRALFRLAYEAGYEGRDAAGFLAQRLGCDVDRATREAASGLIDKLVTEAQRRGANGGDHAAE
jgi:hypothetical protein